MIAIPAGFTPEEYLALEHAAPIRHECRRGLVYAIAGGSGNHSCGDLSRGVDGMDGAGT